MIKQVFDGVGSGGAGRNQYITTAPRDGIAMRLLEVIQMNKDTLQLEGFLKNAFAVEEAAKARGVKPSATAQVTAYVLENTRHNKSLDAADIGMSLDDFVHKNGGSYCFEGEAVEDTAGNNYQGTGFSKAQLWAMPAGRRLDILNSTGTKR